MTDNSLEDKLSQRAAALADQLPVSRTYFEMPLPLVMGLIVTIIYGLVDMYFVSSTGDTDLIAGVSIISPVYTILIALGDSFGYGGGTLIAQYLGKKDTQKTKQISSFSFWSALSFGMIVAILLLVYKKPIVSLLGAGPETFPSGTISISLKHIGLDGRSIREMLSVGFSSSL